MRFLPQSSPDEHELEVLPEDEFSLRLFHLHFLAVLPVEVPVQDKLA